MRFQKRTFLAKAREIAVVTALVGLPITEAASAFPAHTINDMGGSLEQHLRLAQSQSRFLVEDASGPAGETLPLRITLPAKPSESYSFLMFRNLPPDFRLSAGFGTKAYWAVSLPDVNELKLIPPSDFVGAFIMETLLVRSIGNDPERVISNVIFVPANLNEAPEVAAAEPQSLSSKLDALGSPFSGNTPEEQTTGTLPQSGPAERADGLRETRLTPETNAPAEALPRSDPAEDDNPISPTEMSAADKALFARGDTLLQQGDVASARLIYRKLALKNIVESALAMAGTYDPDFLATIQIRGLRPDIEEARYWYEFASKLGSKVAAQRLEVLGTSGN
jgi:hypothetical protein